MRLRKHKNINKPNKDQKQNDTIPDRYQLVVTFIFVLNYKEEVLINSLISL